MKSRGQNAASVAVKTALYLLMACIMVWSVQIKIARYIPDFASTSWGNVQRLIVERHSAPTAQALIDQAGTESNTPATTAPLYFAAVVFFLAIPVFASSLRQMDLSSVSSPSSYQGCDLAGPHLLNLPPPSIA